MSAKTTGAQFKRFYDDPNWWAADGSVWHEDADILVDGTAVGADFDPSQVPDSAVISISGGAVFGVEGEPSLEAFFKRWLRKQETVVLVVEVTTSTADAVRAAIQAAGGKVL